MDLAKYRAVFLEEATEHLAEMGRALLDLEKSEAPADAIDVIFRMAHSIKGMAASLEYDSITQVSHAMEDRMSEIRTAGSVRAVEEMALLFRALEKLEAMVIAVRDTGGPPPADPEIVEALTAAPGPSAPAPVVRKKKVLNP